jgi:hypothetical protein
VTYLLNDLCHSINLHPRRHTYYVEEDKTTLMAWRVVSCLKGTEGKDAKVHPVTRLLTKQRNRSCKHSRSLVNVSLRQLRFVTVHVITPHASQGFRYISLFPPRYGI